MSGSSGEDEAWSLPPEAERIVSIALRGSKPSATSSIKAAQIRAALVALIVNTQQQAYERGRIDEAKTCEQARRHDTKLAVQKALEGLLPFDIGGGEYAVPVSIIQEALAATRPQKERNE